MPINLNNSKKYYNEHIEEFELKNKKTTKMEENKKYIDYKISELKKVNNKVKEEITFYLAKENNLWIIEELDKNDIAKIHGLY